VHCSTTHLFLALETWTTDLKSTIQLSLEDHRPMCKLL